MNRTRKNRVLSVLLALVMAFSAVPVTAFAADDVAVAEVTVDSTTKQYADIDEAFVYAVAEDGSTLKLLADVTTDKEVTVASGSHTLDLNGKALTSTTNGEGFLYISGGTLTIQDSGMGGAITSVQSTLRVNNGGSLTVTGGSFTGGTANGLIVFDGGSAQLSGGTFASKNDPHSIWVVNGEAANLLANGYRYEAEGGALSDYSDNKCGVKGKTTVRKIPEGEVTYIGTDGKETRQEGCKEITAETCELSNGWYVVKGNVTRSYSTGSFSFVSGTVNLILCDGAEWSLPDGGLYMGDNATLNIYAQSAGTGKLTATGMGTKPAIGMDTGMSGGTLNIYGGVITATSHIPSVPPSGEVGVSENRGAAIGTCGGSNSVMTVNINGGTVTAKATYGTAAIGNGQGSTATVNVTIAEGMKCVKTDALTEKAEYSNTDGVSVTITKCDKHLLSYTDNGDGTHKTTCALCGADGGTRAHSFGGWADNGDDTHTGTCICGATSTVAHTLSYVITSTNHKQKCGVCGYETAEAAHSFDPTSGKCDCGADKDIAVEKAEVTMTARDGATWTGVYTDLLEAFKTARLGRWTEEDGITKKDADTVSVKLLQNGATYTLESTDNYPISFEFSHSVTVDLNGCTLKRTVTDNTHGILKVEKGNVTLKNGTLDFTVSTSNNPAAIKLPAGYTPTLTLEDMNINVTGTKKEYGDGNYTGYAIYAGDGKLNIKSGAYGEVQIHSAKVTLSGGSYTEVEHLFNLYTGMLAPGYIFAKQDGTYIDPGTMGKDSETGTWENIENIKVIECKHGGGYLNGTCKQCGAECAHTNVDDTTGNCPDCELQMVARDNNGKYYADLDAAFVGVADKGTVTLLTDVTEAEIYCFVDAEDNLINKTVTLDVNGHSLSRNGVGVTLGVVIGKLTVINSTDGTAPIVITNNSTETDSVAAVGVIGGTLEFGSKVTLTGGLLVTSCTDYEGNTTDGRLEGGLKDGSILLKGSNSYSVSLENSQLNANSRVYSSVRELLPAGYAYAEYTAGMDTENPKIIDGSVKQLTQDVIVVKCTHQNVDETGTERMFKNGVCLGCGYECPHEKLTGNYCDDCGAQMVAQVGERYYSTLAAAIEAAKDNGTVELLEALTFVKESVTVGGDTNVTINMNAVSWEEGNATSPVLTVAGGSVTLNGGCLTIKEASTAKGVVVVQSGSLTLGESMVVGDNGWAGPAIVVEGGDLTLGKGTRLYRGMKTSVTDKTLADYLPERTAFKRYDNKNQSGFITNGYVEDLTDSTGQFQLIVVEHTHDMQAVKDTGTGSGEIMKYRCDCGLECPHKWHFDANGICEDCGSPCKHDYVCDDLDNKTKYCGYCKMYFAVQVTIPNVSDKFYMQTSNSSGGENTLQTILNDDTITPSDCTVTLLANDLIAWAFVDDGKNIKLDLNGKNLIETGNGILVGTGSTLTVTGEGSSSENGQYDLPCVFNVQGGTLVFKDMEFGGTFNSIRVRSGKLTSPRELEDAIKIGTLEIDGANAEVSFKAAAFDKIVFSSNSGSVKLGDLLGVWKDADGNTVRSGNAFRYTTGDKAFVRYDTVIDINNPVENVKTAACTHDRLHGENICDYCGWARLVAIYTTDSGVVGTLTPATEWTETAINRAVNNAFETWNRMGGTLKLFANATLEDHIITNIYATHIDLNGHKFIGGTLTLNTDSKGNGVNVTIKDTSAAKTGAFGNVTLNSGATLAADGVKLGSVTLKDGSKLEGQIGGIFETITAESGSLIDFLPVDYAFADAESHAILDARTKTLNNVTVAEHRAHGNYFWENHERICACGRVVDTDTTAPTVSGIDSSNVCYGDLLFTAEDAYLANVTVDGAEVTADGNRKYTVTADNREHTIIARDMAGNETTVTVTVYKVYRVILPDGVGYTVSGEGTAKHGQNYTFTVKIKEGYTATDEFAVGVKGSSSFAIPQPDSTGTYTFVLPAGQVADDLEVTVEGVRDITAPEAKLTMGQKEFNSFSSSITFGLLLKETQTVRIEAADSGSGVKSVKYYVTDKAMTREAVAAITDWTEGERFVIEAKDGQQFVVYARIEDNAGNVTYLSSDGAEFDTAAPSIGGVADGETHYVTRKISVRDKNLKSVKLNGVEVNPEFTLEGNIEAEYEIEAIDIMGNVATFTIKMRPISALAETFKDRTEANVTADDKGKLDKLGEDIQAMLSSEGVTADESDALNALLKTANGLLERIDEAKSATESKEITAVKDLTKDNVTSDDKEALEKAEKALNDARKDFDGNYTEEERKSLDKQVKTIEEALEAIANAEKAAREIGKLPAADDITAADKGEVERVKKLLEDLTDSEKAMLGKETLDRVTALEDKLRQMEAAARTGDSGQSALWLALLCLSGGTAAAMAVQGNRKKREK